MPQNALSFGAFLPPRYIRFGAFELDSRSGELRKHSIKIRLPQQAFQILLMLLRHPGEVVLREEICQKLWPHDTVVEFDHSINAAVQKLRDALGESADNPRYVETLPRRGYRFIGTLETAPAQSISEPAPLAAAPAESVTTTPAGQTRLPRVWIPLVFALVTLLLSVLSIAGWLRPWTPREAVRNWALPLGTDGVPVISPDGSTVIFSNSKGLFMRRLDSLAEVPLYLTSSLSDLPAWSADGSQVVFSHMTGLSRVRVPDGAPVTISHNFGPTRGVTTNATGTILVAAFDKTVSGLYFVQATGQTQARLEVRGLNGGNFYEPEFLPDGENFLFTWVAYGEVEAGLYLSTLKSGRVIRGPVLLRKNATAGHFSDAGGGNLLYVVDDNLYAQRLNLQSAQLEGESRKVVDGVFSVPAFHRASFSVSRNGVLAWRSGKAARAQLTWFDRHGQTIGSAGPPTDASIVRLSEDEKRILVYNSEIGHPCGIVEAHRNGYVALPGVLQALWTSDSSHILYTNWADRERLLVRTIEGGGEKEVARLPRGGLLRDVSPDGQALLYRSGWSLYSVRLDGLSGTRAAVPVVPPQESVFDARFSPDGRWIVYTSGALDQREVYAKPNAPGGVRTQISLGGGRAPVWRGDGQEILYINGNTLYSVRIHVRSGEIHAHAPEALFKVRLPGTLRGSAQPLAVTRDGSAILFPQATDPSDSMMTYIMTAWDKRLKP